jgi:hypothetical protein
MSLISSFVEARRAQEKVEKHERGLKAVTKAVKVLRGLGVGMNFDQIATRAAREMKDASKVTMLTFISDMSDAERIDAGLPIKKPAHTKKEQ